MNSEKLFIVISFFSFFFSFQQKNRSDKQPLNLKEFKANQKRDGNQQKTKTNIYILYDVTSHTIPYEQHVTLLQSLSSSVDQSVINEIIHMIVAAPTETTVKRRQSREEKNIWWNELKCYILKMNIAEWVWERERANKIYIHYSYIESMEILLYSFISQ